MREEGVSSTLTSSSTLTGPKTTTSNFENEKKLVKNLLHFWRARDRDTSKNTGTFQQANIGLLFFPLVLVVVWTSSPKFIKFKFKSYETSLAAGLWIIRGTIELTRRSLLFVLSW